MMSIVSTIMGKSVPPTSSYSEKMKHWDVFLSEVLFGLNVNVPAASLTTVD